VPLKRALAIAIFVLIVGEEEEEEEEESSSFDIILLRGANHKKRSVQNFDLGFAFALYKKSLAQEEGYGACFSREGSAEVKSENCS
jgi:hypothetical protein